MLFNSLSYCIFLPIVFVLYWVVPYRFKWLILLISSYYFYMSWNLKYVVLIFITTFVSYLASIYIEKELDKSKRKIILFLAILICMGILFVFKYFNFVIESIVNILNFTGLSLKPITLKLLLPVGISFYTFQTMSYVIDVYRGRIKAEHHFGHYATFISFFPQLVAGPIERASNLLPQIKEVKSFDYNKANEGFFLILIGLFKKMVIADNYNVVVAQVFENVYLYKGFSLIFAVFLFAIQIYCDFSGYSDIAIGTAKLFNVDLIRNFNRPYFSTSLKEFWSRWHISLSTWFRDYIYIPLGGNRVSKLRNQINLFVTFLLSGLWHGANWTFVCWGVIHGLFLIFERIYLKNEAFKNRIVKCIYAILVFAFCCFAWIFFVSKNINDASYVLESIFNGISNPFYYAIYGLRDLGIGRYRVVFEGCVFLLLFLYESFSFKIDYCQKFIKLDKFKRIIVSVIIILFILAFGYMDKSQFVYFQF